MTTTTTRDNETLSWFKVATLIVAFLILAVFMPWGLASPEGDFRTWCGMLSLSSFFYLVGAIFV